MSSVAAVILAAGLSTRMGGANKLLAELDGRPVLRHTVENVLASPARPIVVVTGHQHDAVQELIQDLPVTCCFNTDFAEGMATSLSAGIGALPPSAAGALIFLGDMPLIGGQIVADLIDVFDEARAQQIVIPVQNGRRGHPVLWGRGYFSELRMLTGDQGARQLLTKHASRIVECEVADPAIFMDADTPSALQELQSRSGR